MALSGTIYGSTISSGYRLEIDWSATQDISANTSTITASVYWHSLGSAYTINSSTTKSGSTTIDGTSSSWSVSGAHLNGNERRLLNTYTRTVSHNTDGTKSLTISSVFSCAVTLSGTYYSNASASGSVTLDTIPRASTLSSSPSWTAGNDFTISISRASSNFVHSAYIYVNGVLIKELTNVGTSVTSAFTSDENKVIFQQLNGASTQDTRIDLVTYAYAGGSEIGENNYYGTVTAPSASTVSNDTDRSVYIDQNITIGISRANSNFTHTVVVSCGSFSKTFTNVGTSITWTPSSSEQQSLYSQTPNANSVDGNIRITTYYNGVQVRSYTDNDYDFYVRNSNPTFTGGFTYKDINSTTYNITGNDQYIVQNNSDVQITIPLASKASAINGASMSSYVATLNGISKSASYSSTNDIIIDFGTVDAGANLTLTIKAIDSRGNSTSVGKIVTIIPYKSPTLHASLSRLNNFDTPTTLSTDGNISLLNVNGTNKNTISALQYRYKPKTSSTWTAWTNLVYTLTMPNFTGTDVTVDLDNLQAWDVQIQVIDKITTTTVSQSVSQGIPLIFIDTVKKSIGINQFPQNNDDFEVDGDILLNNEQIPISSQSANVSGKDLNTVTRSGFYRLSTSLLNAPTGMDYGQLLVGHGGGDTITQIIANYQNTEMYFRSGNPTDVGGAGSWGTWRRIWHDGNFTPSKYLRNDQDGTLSGKLTTTGGFGGLGRIPAYTWTGTIDVNNSVTLTHNLGYNPIVSHGGTVGNAIPTFEYTDTNNLRVYNYTTGGNPWTGTVNLW